MSIALAGGLHRVLALAANVRRNGLRCLNLRHEIVVPGTINLEMGSRTEFDCLDKVVRQIGVNAGLPESVQRCPAEPPRMNQVSRFVSGRFENFPVSHTKSP